MSLGVIAPQISCDACANFNLAMCQDGSIENQFANIEHDLVAVHFIGHRSLICRLFRVRIKVMATHVNVYRFIFVLIKYGRVANRILVVDLIGHGHHVQFSSAQIRKWNGDNERFVTYPRTWTCILEFRRIKSYFLFFFHSLFCSSFAVDRIDPVHLRSTRFRCIVRCILRCVQQWNWNRHI